MRLAGQRAAWALLALAAVAVLVLASPTLRWIDIQLLDESLKDHWGLWRHGEDWATAAPLPTGLRYEWLASGARPLRIAHALGEAGQAGQNTLPALRRALTAGFSLLEIDVWLDDAGQLRCHHGPLPPAPLTNGECTLRDAARTAASSDAWLVLDIKTDFQATSQAIARQFAGDPSAARLVFQLYRPTDVGHFLSIASELHLPGPIVTAYRARRSLRHILGHLERLQVRAFTFPLYRGDALPTPRPQGIALLVHPVHDCAELEAARRLQADGMYLNTTMTARSPGSCSVP